MTYKNARSKVENILSKFYKEYVVPIIIDEEFSFEFSRGWVFLYNSRNYIENRNNTENYLLVATPLLVDKIDGSIYKLFDIKRRFVDPKDLIEDYVLRKEDGVLPICEKDISNYEFNEIPFAFPC